MVQPLLFSLFPNVRGRTSLILALVLFGVDKIIFLVYNTLSTSLSFLLIYGRSRSMVNINAISKGMQLLYYASNVMRLLEREGQNPGEGESQEEMAFLGRVFSVNLQENLVTLKVRDELQNFSPDQLWLIPDKTMDMPPEKVYHQPHRTEYSASSSRDRNLLRLMGGYILTLSEGEINPAILGEVAGEIRKSGIAQKSVKAQEFLSKI